MLYVPYVHLTKTRPILQNKPILYSARMFHKEGLRPWGFSYKGTLLVACLEGLGDKTNWLAENLSLRLPLTVESSESGQVLGYSHESWVYLVVRQSPAGNNVVAIRYQATAEDKLRRLYVRAAVTTVEREVVTALQLISVPIRKVTINPTIIQTSCLVSISWIVYIYI
jgi:hypothetical protein